MCSPPSHCHTCEYVIFQIQAGRWKIFQKIDRHRYSTDDLVTSWVACNESKRLGYISPNMLDIGCGLGSVLMCNAWQLPTARCIGIEFQQVGFNLVMTILFVDTRYRRRTQKFMLLLYIFSFRIDIRVRSGPSNTIWVNIHSISQEYKYSMVTYEIQWNCSKLNCRGYENSIS